MKSRTAWIGRILVLLGAGAAASAFSQTLALSDRPLFLTGDVPPFVMLNLSKDHQLSYKAYNDFTDLDADGTIDTSYKHSFNYYGYFDPTKCYTYSGGYFQPAELSTTKYCTGQWSGNFLNWASMTRMDIVRKILYGGTRIASQDTGSLTVLERAYLPTDGHAFAKYYNGTDIAQLTPFTTTRNAPETGTSGTSLTIRAGDTDTITLSGLSVHLGDQIRIEDAGDSRRWMVGGVFERSGSSMRLRVEAGGFSGEGAGSNWRVTNLSSTGITLCNVTLGSGSTASQGITNPPLIRVARGNFTLWGANEQQQCLWSEERANLQGGFEGGFRSNGNRALLSGIDASAENPRLDTHALGSGNAAGSYIARMEVCRSGLIGAETCKVYEAGNHKPVGLLQQYGDDGRIQYGLMTGSFEKNVSGGVLRAPVSDFGAGVNQRTSDASRDGTFKRSGGRAVNGIVRTLDALRIYGYRYDQGDSYGRGDGCTYQRTAIEVSGASGPAVNEGNCSSWGNPMAEIYYESLRYLASTPSTAPTPAFTYTNSGSRDAALGLTYVSSWTPPLNEVNWCTPLSVLNFNASVSSYDADQLGNMSSIGSTSTAAALTQRVGDLEGITGESWFTGSNGSTDDALCSAKDVTNFGQALGLCPEAPSTKGSYSIAGLAFHARTNRIKTPPAAANVDAFPNSLKVETYGVALATNVPRIEVMAGGRKIVILPAYRLDLSSSGAGPFGGGTLVDFKVVTQTPTYGKYYVNWEDSGFGGDYDQDMWGTIEYEVLSDNTVRVTTDAISASTGNGQGFGYVISGTDRDGPHFHSGILRFDFTEPAGRALTVRNRAGTLLNSATGGPINASGGCRDCAVADAATSVTYTVTGISAGSLKDPLWYAAKYGGFKDANDNGIPDLASEWDSAGQGTPDNFVFANDPVKLVAGLSKAFEQIGKRRAAAASVAANTTQLNTDTAVFQARFDSTDWSGRLIAFRLNDNGSLGAQLWDAESVMPAPADRNIFTRNDLGVTTFEWANLSATQRAALNRGPSGAADAAGSDRVDYLRGERSEERQSGGVFRDRSTTLGDIVNSDPFYLKQQYFRYETLPGSEGSSYLAFVASTASRTPALYVGANDGMLHAFNASTSGVDQGKELFAYVPKAVLNDLGQLTYSAYADTHRYFVDGGPYVGEAYLSGGWKSVLVSGLGAGGKAVFAIDVTDPNAVTASQMLWEFTDADLCYTFSQPQIGRLVNGRWVAIFGNGYPNTNAGASVDRQCATTGAYLYIVDLQTGDPIRKIATGAEAAYDGPNNGLSTPALLDVNGDRIIDVVYAGDLRGNLWAYSLTDGNPANWDVKHRSGGLARPLFRALNASSESEPITGAVEIGRHPNGGFLVYFGTGRYVAEGDPSNDEVQSLYAIWDQRDSSGDDRLEGSNVPVSDRSALQQQSIVSEGTIGTNRVRTTSANGVDWLTKRGWYMDLSRPSPAPVQGERVVSTPILASGRVFFTTVIPSTVTCTFGGTSWLMQLDAVTGGRIDRPVFDANEDNNFTTAGDYLNSIPISGLQSGTGIAKTSGPIVSGNRLYLPQTDTSGNDPKLVTTPHSGKSPRGSWRQVFGL